MRAAPGWFAAALLALPAAGFAASGQPPDASAAAAWQAAITDAAADGLDPAAYQDAASLARDLSAGRLDPRSADPDWHIPRPEPVGNPGSGLLPDAVRPASADYARLREALRRYLAIRDSGGWPALPPGAPLRAGQRDPRVATLRERLRRSGDFDSEVGADPWFFDAALDRALRHFQQRVGLQASGFVDEPTFSALNTSVEQRIGRLAATLERWRWLPRQPGTEYVWINIATGMLEVIGPGGPQFAMRVMEMARRTSTMLKPPALERRWRRRIAIMATLLPCNCP